MQNTINYRMENFNIIQILNDSFCDGDEDAENTRSLKLINYLDCKLAKRAAENEADPSITSQGQPGHHYHKENTDRGCQEYVTTQSRQQKIETFEESTSGIRVTDHSSKDKHQRVDLDKISPVPTPKPDSSTPTVPYDKETTSIYGRNREYVMKQSENIKTEICEKSNTVDYTEFEHHKFDEDKARLSPVSMPDSSTVSFPDVPFERKAYSNVNSSFVATSSQSFVPSLTLSCSYCSPGGASPSDQDFVIHRSPLVVDSTLCTRGTCTKEDFVKIENDNDNNVQTPHLCLENHLDDLHVCSSSVDFERSLQELKEHSLNSVVSGSESTVLVGCQNNVTDINSDISSETGGGIENEKSSDTDSVHLQKAFNDAFDIATHLIKSIHQSKTNVNTKLLGDEFKDALQSTVDTFFNHSGGIYHRNKKQDLHREEPSSGEGEASEKSGVSSHLQEEIMVSEETPSFDSVQPSSELMACQPNVPPMNLCMEEVHEYVEPEKEEAEDPEQFLHRDKSPLSSPINTRGHEDRDKSGTHSLSGIYICTICLLSFKSEDHLACHKERTHAKGFVAKCPNCVKVYCNFNRLKDHVKRRHNHGAHICDLCRKIYSSDNDLQRHNKDKHDRPHMFQCSTCNDSFSNQQRLHRHMTKHGRERPYECKLCFKTFKTETDYLQHQHRYHANGPFTCRHCKKKFNSWVIRKSHVRTVHSKLKAYHCSKCPKRFSQLKSYERHMNAHKQRDNSPSSSSLNTRGQEDRFKSGTHALPGIHLCDICLLSVKSEYHLARHKELKHAKRFVTKCPNCGKVYSNSNRLKHHVKRRHNHEAHICDLCRKIYRNEKDLRRHNKHKHEHLHIVRCSTCNDGFSNQQRLHRHMTKHGRERPYECKLCLKTFKTKPNYIQHQHRYHANGIFTCYHCRKKFHSRVIWKSHVRTVHFKLKAYHCSQCPKRFSQLKSYECHMNAHKNMAPYQCEQCTQAFCSPLELRHHAASQHE